MQFEEIGNMSGKTLMLLPGTCCDWQTNFGTVIDRLSEKYHLICVNYDGFDGAIGSYNRLKSYIQTAIDMDELPNINNHLNSTKKINWLKGFDVAMKNQVTDQYSYQERSEQIKLRSYFEKQHQDIELRNRLTLAKG